MSKPHLANEEKRKLRLVLAHILNNPGFRLSTSKDQTKAIYALSSMCSCSLPELQLVAIKELLRHVAGLDGGPLHPGTVPH